MIDCKLGGTVDHGDGRIVKIQPHSQREYLAVYGKTVYEFFLYENPQPNEEESDRINVIIKDYDGKFTNWLMNVEDAVVFIRGLSLCIQKAIEIGIPLKPQ